MNTPPSSTSRIDEITQNMRRIWPVEADLATKGLTRSAGRGLSRAKFGAQWVLGMFDGTGTGGFTSPHVVVVINSTSEDAEAMWGWAKRFARNTGAACIVGAKTRFEVSAVIIIKL